MPDIINALLIKQGSVLLARRSHHRKAYPNLWSFPGGHVEPGETFCETLIREAIEEIGIVPVAYSVVAQIAADNASSEPVTYHVFAVREWTRQPSLINDEHTEIRWFTIEEARALPDLAPEQFRPLFDSVMFRARSNR